jgi:shikimate dehydrogenase
VDRYAVIGHPVAHSRSPEIHLAFAKQCGQRMEYTRLLAPREGFAAALEQFRAEGGLGANITVPFKEEAFKLAASHSGRAAAAGAANYLEFRVEGIHSDNTDGAGLVRDVRGNLGVAIEGKRVLLLGAGGAARGAAGPLLDERPALLCIANRTGSRADALAALFPGLRAVKFEQLGRESFDLVINATAVSLAGETLPLGGVYAAGALAYDMMYGAHPTPFMRHARDCGAQACDGLGMLVEQAAESFFLWRGVRPETRPVIEALRKAL